MLSQTMCLDQVRCSPLPRGLTVQRLVWDWNDPSEVVETEIRRIGEKRNRGCWYLNPMFRVYNPEPTQFFLGVVRRRQREWFRKLSRQFGSSNWRRLFDVTKNVYQRRIGFTGVLFIDGQEIDPRSQWQLEAQVGMHPGSDLVLSRRPQASAYLKEGNWEALKDLSRFELEQQLANSPLDPLYVNPGIAVMGFNADPAFYAEARKRSNEWHGRLARIFGNREMHALCRQSDWTTQLLVFHGALVIDGLIYLPGFWPDRPLEPKRLRSTPLGSPTVPVNHLMSSMNPSI